VRPNESDLRDHYAGLSDEALLEIDPEELTDVARKCHREEVAHRKLDAAPEKTPVRESAPNAAAELDTMIVSFVPFPGNEAEVRASQTCAALHRAGIPAEVETVDYVPYTPPANPPKHELHVMIPAAMLYRAQTVLDKEIYNLQNAETLQLHLAELSDEELLALDEDALVGGLKDRIEQTMRVLEEELDRRGL
jgi:hypothetical protein